jgi:O-antigen/teichoic acid export membrane protein
MPAVTASGSGPGEPGGATDESGHLRGRAAALFAELGRRDVEYVVVRGGHLLENAEIGELRVLVRDDQLAMVEEIAHRARLSPVPARVGFERLWTSNGEGSEGASERLRIAITTSLVYGRGRKCLRTGPQETPVLRRRRAHAGVALASACDELMDLVLHCVLDVGVFADAHRRRATQLVAELRADPPSAGRAAERFQQELAPALPWSVVLADVLHGRWDDLLARRARLARHLVRRAPLATLRGLSSRRIPSGPPTRNGTHEAHDTNANAVAADDAQPPATTRTDSTARADATRPPPSAAAVSRKQIRGSGLFLFGRALSAGLKFTSELIIVRYLATNQYGAWTYALAAVAFMRGISTFGLNRAIARYLPLHLERNEIDKFYGVLVVVGALMTLAGAAVVAAFFAFPRFVAGLAGVVAEQPLQLLFILIFLVPLEQLDNALTGICAALGVSRPIFFRRFILNPGLRLLIAAGLVLAAADVEMLAYGYIVAGVIGVGYYAWAVLARLRKQGLLKMRWLRGAPLPFKTVLQYTTPVMAADWCTVFMATAGPLLLGYFTDMSAVALYQVVIPVAALNHLVPQAFAMLFEPSASRLVARGDRVGLGRHYWNTAMWVAVLSFPLFALSFTAAVPLTVLLFGERYAAAAPILSIIALSQFVEAAAGFNAGTLRVSGKIRWLIAANVIGVVVLLAVSVVLIPSMGALGAGIGTAAGQLTYTLLNQAFVRIAVGVDSVDLEHSGFYLMMIVVFGAFLAVRVMAPANLWIITPVVLIGVLAVFLMARRSLSVGDTFPELARIPLLGRILG